MYKISILPIREYENKLLHQVHKSIALTEAQMCHLYATVVTVVTVELFTC